jgi:hypothetical protein
MARIIVTAGRSAPQDEALVLLEESVQSIHLRSDHAARQLIERLTWALDDAEALERDGASSSARQPQQQTRGGARRRQAYSVSSALT